MQSYKFTEAILHISPDKESLAKDLAQSFLQKCRQAVHERNSFSVALSGGSTPKALYALLAEAPYAGEIPWDKVFVFWGDERCVPPTSLESNFAMASEALLSRVPIPRQNIFAFQAQDKDRQASAAMYEEALKEFFALAAGDFPAFDLILLGLGPEGHCASIFPQSLALTEAKRLVMPVFVDDAHGFRLTFTMNTINHARAVSFMVEGQGKSEILAQVLESGEKSLPAQYVHPREGLLEWFVDSQAASALRQKNTGNKI